MGGHGLKEAERFLLFADFAVSFFNTFSGSLPMLLVRRSLELGILQRRIGEVLNGSLFLLSALFFSWLELLTRGGSCNPLIVLSSAMNGDTSMFLRTVAARLLAQLAGSLASAVLSRKAFPEVGDGLCTNVNTYEGALTEGLGAFLYVLIHLLAKRKYSNNFFQRASIMGVSRLTLRLLTGGCMNPAFAFGWAFSRGDHATRDHLFVYWLAPLEATLLGFWVSLLVEEAKPQDDEKKKSKFHIHIKQN